jgi:NAD(P)-dependent dehydrogenase (short-subunit alcohol dehydrogenase family)
MQNAIVTGASTGLGRALATELARAGWQLTIDARHAVPLDAAADAIAHDGAVDAIAGDISDPAHRQQLVNTASARGPVQLIVNNASELGGSPLPRLRELTGPTLEHLFAVNVSAPQDLIRLALPRLADDAVIVNISSDAAVDHYEGWGGYAASKAALDHLTLTWAVEEPRFTWYAVDPGDMRTAMHQAAFPGEDISDRPEPESVAPLLVRLITSGLPSGRYRAEELVSRHDLSGDAGPRTGEVKVP